MAYRPFLSLLAGLVGLGLAAPMPAAADAPWIEPGDASLRSDVEILAAHGLIDGLTTTWPLPSGQILARLSHPAALDGQPAYVRAAAAHVLDALSRHGQPQGFQAQAGARLTTRGNAVRSFDAAARNEVDAYAGVDWAGNASNARLRLGQQSRADGRESRVALDGSYVSARWDNWLLYGGWVDQWQGPGWDSSLALSNNARPFPKLGIMRNDPHAFDTPWLSWLGPWQLNLLGGVLDDDRVARNTGYLSVRAAIMPLKGLELAISRNMILCGKGHECNPPASFFHVENTDSNPNNVGDSATMEAKYTRTVGTVLVSPYAQFYNRDNGPFTHSYTSHLYGLSLAGALGARGARWRVTAEYADSVPTMNFFGGGYANGAAYNSYRYPLDGFRYQGRSLGFSLDSDSRLLSLAGSVTDGRGWTYRLAYHHARINSATLADRNGFYDPVHSYNPVSARPVSINQLEAGLSVPFRRFTLTGTLRVQDRDVYPHSAAVVVAEAAIDYRF